MAATKIATHKMAATKMAATKRDAKKRGAKKTRHAGRPTGKTSDDIVRSVLRATLANLKKRGYDGLSIEEIAKAAQVAKTSIYRRWPTKQKLLLAAWLLFRSEHSPAFTASDDVRADVISLTMSRVARIEPVEARMLTVGLLSSPEPETTQLLEQLYETTAGPIRQRIEAALSKRKRSAARAQDAAEMLIAWMIYRVIHRKRGITRADAERAVDAVLAGAGLRDEKLHSLH